MKPTKQEKKMEHFKNVKKVLGAHHTALTRVPEVLMAFDKFSKDLEEIDSLHKETSRNLGPLVKKKKRAALELSFTITPIANILQVLSYDLKDKKLEKQVSSRMKKMKSLKDTELIDYGNDLQQTAKMLYDLSINADRQLEEGKLPKYAIDITAYGLTHEMIEGLQKRIDTFTRVLMEVKDALKHQAKVKNRLDILVKSNNQLLKKKITPLLLLFKNSDPALYNSFMTAGSVKETVTKTGIETNKARTKTVRRSSSAAKRPLKSSPGAKTRTTQKRGTARPGKTNQTVSTPKKTGVKRGPGRPRKNPPA